MTGARTVTCSGDSVSLKQVADPNLLVAKGSHQEGAGVYVNTLWHLFRGLLD